MLAGTGATLGRSMKQAFADVMNDPNTGAQSSHAIGNPDYIEELSTRAWEAVGEVIVRHITSNARVMISAMPLEVATGLPTVVAAHNIHTHANVELNTIV